MPVHFIPASKTGKSSEPGCDTPAKEYAGGGSRHKDLGCPMNTNSTGHMRQSCYSHCHRADARRLVGLWTFQESVSWNGPSMKFAFASQWRSLEGRCDDNDYAQARPSA
ncbi:hypothetical protein POX_e07214 [Penicillium oxalicum]|uniref:hypothetical protein n=1 Tax=Penicillium oxalicum TaxID=69781 RepID=UPI0020B7FDCB|nr:hypothetical protein POX_e07214 [Penicillium oxalicum]KAI2789185.1 hypothetical protein POX_e07214 [Penicillium oxalicum]